MIRVQYTTRKFVINAKTIKFFKIIDDERRMLRPGHVASIRAQFDKDILDRHFDSPIVVNYRSSEDKEVIIDGNHRIEAIKQKLESDPDFAIEAWLNEYKDLTREEERLIYKKWQRGIAQTANDYLANHAKTIPLLDKLMKELPVSINGSDKLLQVKNVMGCQIYAKQQKKFIGHYRGGGERTVADLQSLEFGDVQLVKAFLNDYREVFGEYYKGNSWYRMTPYVVFYRLWYDNRKNIPRQHLIESWKRNFAARTVFWTDSLRPVGRDAEILLYHTVLDTLNRHTKKHHWLCDDEIIKPTAVTV